MELFKINTNYPVRDVKIQSIRNACNEAGIGCPNINKHLMLKHMIDKLIEVEGVLKDKIAVKHTLVYKIDTLLGDIND